MDSGMTNWYKAAQKRYSVRRYRQEPSLEDMLALESAAASLSVRGVRIAVGIEQKVFSGILGSRIKGTSAFAAFVTSNGDETSLGYLGEAFILECTSLGLGTCWLGANFNRSAASNTINLKKGEKIVCVTPIGVADEPFVRRKRRGVAELTWLDDEEFEQLSAWQRSAVQCAILAPSAVNKQPYELIPENGGITVADGGNNFGFGKVDRGIVMLHIELGAAAEGVRGAWHKHGDDMCFMPENE
jgi:hypothetical protein